MGSIINKTFLVSASAAKELQSETVVRVIDKIVFGPNYGTHYLAIVIFPIIVGYTGKTVIIHPTDMGMLLIKPKKLLKQLVKDQIQLDQIGESYHYNESIKNKKS